MKFSLILSNTKKSVLYAKTLSKFEFYPEEIVYLDDNKKNKLLKFLKSSKFKNVKIKKFNSLNIDKMTSKYILRTPTRYYIYSGYPGVIIRDGEILKKKKIVHFHPGKLPDFKGSTTIYYSILKERKIFCSTLYLNHKIDQGRIIGIYKYPIPKKIKEIDLNYDNYIRCQNLIKFLKSNKKFYENKNNIFFNQYYVIHPVLRSIVFKKFNENKKKK